MEGAEGLGPTQEEIKGIETLEAENIKTPYAVVFAKEAIEKHPDKKNELLAAFNEFDRQVLENLTINNYDGVKFTSSKIEVTPDVINRIAGNTKVDAGPNVQNSEADDIQMSPDARNVSVFCFPGIQPPGSILGIEDMAIDRFFRLLPRVARAMKAGEQVPNVEIYIMGQPNEYGGEITDEWYNDLKSTGFTAYGKLYSRFMQENLSPDQLDKTNVVMQGYSMGAATASKTYEQLPQEIREHTQQLYDNPAGTTSNPLRALAARAVWS